MPECKCGYCIFEHVGEAMTKEYAAKVKSTLERFDQLQIEIRRMDVVLKVLTSEGGCTVNFYGKTSTGALESDENPNLQRVLYSAIACEKVRLERDCEKLSLSHCDKM
jgi:hypothetical protein